MICRKFILAIYKRGGVAGHKKRIKKSPQYRFSPGVFDFKRGNTCGKCRASTRFSTGGTLQCPPFPLAVRFFVGHITVCL